MSESTVFEMPSTWAIGDPCPEDLRNKHFDSEKKRWAIRPGLPSCCKGSEPVWNAHGLSYQCQLFCTHWGVFINPVGISCALCAQGQFPEKERIKSQIKCKLANEDNLNADTLLTMENDLVRMIQDGMLTEEDAYEIIEETGLEEAVRDAK